MVLEDKFTTSSMKTTKESCWGAVTCTQTKGYEGEDSRKPGQLQQTLGVKLKSQLLRRSRCKKANCYQVKMINKQ